MLIIVGTYGEKLGHVAGKGHGLYVLDVDDETLQVEDHASETAALLFGKPQLGKTALNGMINPTYLISHESQSTDSSSTVVIYVVDEREDCPGTLRAATLNKSTGELTQLGDAIVADDRPHEGGACCHVMVTPDEEYVLAANYACGSIVAVGRNKNDGSLNGEDVHYYHLPPSEVGDAKKNITFPGPNPNRQERAHAHMVVYSKGRSSDTILVPDLGSDVVWSIPYLGRHSANSNKSPLGTPAASKQSPVLEGGGPRHLVLHPNPDIRKIYVAYELTSLVASFNLDEETGAIISSTPEICNVLAGPASDVFLSSGAGVAESDAKNRRYKHLLSEGSSGVKVCSDNDTSVAAIRIVPDGSCMLVSSRIVGAEGAISAIPLTAEGNLASSESSVRIRIRGTGGQTPRDFVVVNGVVIAANQDTDEIVVLREGKDPEIMTKDAPTPVCLCIVPK